MQNDFKLDKLEKDQEIFRRLKLTEARLWVIIELF